MSQNRQNLYEGMYIISAKLSDDARNKAFDKIKSGITSRGGEILKIHEQGRKRLAYEINGHREGHYYIIYFKAPTQTVGELWKEYHISEDLVRFITLTAHEVMEKLEFKAIAEEI
jgi:small subunit ribosomal protein S6